jgi:hypothetical protein
MAKDEGSVARLKTSFEEKAVWMRERQVLAPASTSPAAPGGFAERHYAVSQIAELWSLSADAVRKLFQDEPGVLVLGGEGSPHKRRYTTLRIPESVLQRVHRRMTNV